jgi:hypothetical protein
LTMVYSINQLSGREARTSNDDRHGPSPSSSIFGGIFSHQLKALWLMGDYKVLPSMPGVED